MCCKTFTVMDNETELRIVSAGDRVTPCRKFATKPKL